ncbi:retrovirus-related pol polyprotein from transposon TNT 1-94 [Tanacetum coccineum]
MSHEGLHNGHNKDIVEENSVNFMDNNFHYSFDCSTVLAHRQVTVDYVLFAPYTWRLDFLRTKDEAPKMIKKFIAQVQLNFNVKIQKVRTDNGTEFKNAILQAHYEKLGINAAILYCKEAHHITRHNKSPYELLRGRKSNVEYFHVFESLCYPTNEQEDLGKMKPKANIGIFIGYSVSSRAKVYKQEKGIDFKESFSLVARLEAVRIQPDGFVDPDFQDHIYKLKKALYGLKQAPKAWSQLCIEILNKHGMDECDSMSTPMATARLDAILQGTSTDQAKYHSMTRGLMYLTAIKPNIAFATFTYNMGLWYPKDSGFELISYSDADHAGSHDDWKSTSGGLQFLVIWMRTQLLDYRYKFNKIPMDCDSKSAIAISCNPVQYSRTKHIDIRIPLLLRIFQLADIFTKALPNERFEYLVHQIDVPTTQSQLIESTQGMHRTSSAPRIPNPEITKGESSAQRKPTVIRFRVPKRPDPKTPIPTAAEVDITNLEEHMVDEEIEPRSDKEIPEAKKSVDDVTITNDDVEEESVGDEYDTPSSVGGDKGGKKNPRKLTVYDIYTLIIFTKTQHWKRRKSFHQLAIHLQSIMEEVLPSMVGDRVNEIAKKIVPLYIVEGLLLDRQKTQVDVATMIAEAV